MGNVQVRGDMLMRGYLDLAVSAQAFTRDGWFRTGDIGGIDRLGWINIVDRGNRKLSDALGDEGYCASIEDAVRELPGVDDAVIAVSADARDLIVFVQTKSGAAVDAGTVGALLADRAHWTGAVHVRTLDSLPRLASGKVARSALVAEAG
jgi:acyl-CoA synthetase (AMP-forming)/AMP-acid ligase II